MEQSRQLSHGGWEAEVPCLGPGLLPAATSLEVLTLLFQRRQHRLGERPSLGHLKSEARASEE